MEIFILVLLYYFSQNPDFAESVKPLMAKLKDSEQMLKFLNDLSNFTQTFSTFQSQPKKDCDKNSERPPEHEPPSPPPCDTEKKHPQSPTAGIADEFIEQLLNGYLKKH